MRGISCADTGDDRMADIARVIGKEQLKMMISLFPLQKKIEAERVRRSTTTTRRILRWLKNTLAKVKPKGRLINTRRWQKVRKLLDEERWCCLQKGRRY